MSTGFNEFMGGLETEAKAEGPKAVQELRMFKSYFAGQAKYYNTEDLIDFTSTNSISVSRRKSFKHRMFQWLSYALHRLATFIGSVQVKCLTCDQYIRADYDQCDRCLDSERIDRF
jgi:hypothetical protein